jgi:alkanesulfonate monooxygenase SsuD/methylene tetrahydromethanopterin reductase-like flavin-dependent oxidoreductase (luciferase family)
VTVRFGIMVSNDDPAAMDPRQRIAEHVERAVVARDSGFDSVAVGHRYSYGPVRADERGQPLGTWRFQAVPLLAHLAGHLGDTVDYVSAVLLSTSAHPVQLAEDIATLDAMTGGRLRVGIGLGWMPVEFEAFGVEPKVRARRLEELIEATRALLTQDEVDFAGRHFRFREARLVARTVQRPAPPIWLGASAEPAIVRAARLGDSWSISAISSLAELRPQVALYRAELARLGRPVPDDRPINRWVYIAEDRRTALDEAMPVLAEWHRKRGTWGWFKARAEDGTIADDVLGNGRWIIGDPQDCVDQIATLRKELDVNHLIFTMPWPGTPQERRLRTLRLLGEHVLPAFRGVDSA